MKPTQSNIEATRAKVQATKKRHFNLAALIVIGMMLLVFFVGGLFIYWLYQPTHVIDFKTYPIPIRTIRRPPPAGGVVILHVNYCKNDNVTGHVRTSFVSSSREVFAPMSDERQPKGCVNQELPILIPADLTPDTYHVHFRVDYQINPLSHSIENFDTKSFAVD